MDSLPFTVVDIIVVAVLLISALLAFARGFVHEVLSVAGWIGAIFAAIYGFPYLKPHARDLIPIEVAADLAAGAVIFIVTLILLSFLTRAIAKQVQASALNALDRSLGFLFGLLRGAILVCLIYIGVEWMMPVQDQPGWLRNAKTMPLIETGAGILKSLVPEDAAKAGNKAATEAKEKTQKVLETQKMLRDLTTPTPKGAEKKPADGYGKQERQGLERLIDATK